MRLLLDSHVLIWWLAGNAKLRLATRELIEDGDVSVSIASCWELGSAQAAGRLAFEDDLFEAMAVNEFRLLSIEVDDVRAATGLPRIHLDPFDRMLVAQALRRRMVLVTADSKLQRLGAAILPA